MEKVSGVYTITCKVNKRRYVGSSTHVYSRWKAHRSALNLGKHSVLLLQADWDAHGAAAFEFRVVAEVRDRDERLAVEQSLIELYDTTRSGYNRSPSARDCTGIRLSPEHRLAIGEANRGVPKSAEHRAALRDAQKRVWAEREMTPEARERLAEFGRRGKGRPKSEDHRRKISEAQKGREFTPEHLANLRAAKSNGGKPLKLDAGKVREIKRRLAEGASCAGLAREYGVKPASISDIKAGRSWRHIT